VNVPELVAVPPAVVILIFPVNAPAGTVAVTCVPEITVKTVAFTPPIARLLGEEPDFEAGLNRGEGARAIKLPWIELFNNVIYGENDTPFLNITPNTSVDPLNVVSGSVKLSGSLPRISA
jgi:hypothetical protein